MPFTGPAPCVYSVFLHKFLSFSKKRGQNWLTSGQALTKSSVWLSTLILFISQCSTPCHRPIPAALKQPKTFFLYLSNIEKIKAEKMDITWWMRSSLVVRPSDCQCWSRNSPGFDPSSLRHSGIWGAADEAVLNTVHRDYHTTKGKKILL